MFVVTTKLEPNAYFEYAQHPVVRCGFCIVYRSHWRGCDERGRWQIHSSTHIDTNAFCEYAIDDALSRPYGFTGRASLTARQENAFKQSSQLGQRRKTIRHTLRPFPNWITMLDCWCCCCCYPIRRFRWRFAIDTGTPKFSTAHAQWTRSNTNRTLTANYSAV